MKLSFSTRGWSALSFEDWTALASEQGFNGIEVYDAQDDAKLVGHGGALEARTSPATIRTLKGKSLEIPVFDTSIDLTSPDAADRLKTTIKLAHDAYCGLVGVLAGSDDEAAVRATLDACLQTAIDNEVIILVKTQGIYADTTRLMALLDSYAIDNIACLWEVVHPYRENGEKAGVTIKNLGAYVKHVHITDSDEDHSPNLVGEGDLPIGDFINALSSLNYSGFVSLEWVPEWMEDLTDPEIIFPHFVNYMQGFDDTKSNKRPFFKNHDGSGEYLWEKYDLIDHTFPQVLDAMVDAFPDQYAFKYTTLDYTRTYEEFRKDVDDFARALVSLGVKPGSKVAIWATNVPAWFITFWATTKIGAVLVTVNTAYKIHEARYLLRQSDTHTLVMIDRALDSDYAAIINELCPELATSEPGKPLRCKELPFLRNVITVGFEMPGCLTFEQAFERAESVSLEKIKRMAAEVKPDDVCNMQYTSGTTGFPKGVMLTHRNVVNDGKCIGDRMGLSTADRMMIQVPMFHCFGMTLSMTSSMTHGTTMCPMPYFSAKASLSCITQERITCFNGVPTMFIAMFSHADYRNTDFSHMRTGIMAGSGCPPELMRKAAQPDEMNMRGIVSVYGQTESAPGSVMTAWTDTLEQRTETVGYEYPHIECKIINPNTGEEMPVGTNGEFCSRGYNTMKGYYKMPEATAKAIDAEGWLHSGDLVMKREDGCYVVTGRIKDMIIRGGENLYPKEIEEFILTHNKVEDVQVVGVPDEKYGEEAAACIILRRGEQATEDEMREFIRASLARHKVPRYIKFVDSFPMNAAGKILKYKMRESLTEELGLSHLVKDD